MPPSFNERAREAIARRGRLCAGVDPHPELLAEWNLPDDASGLAAFAQKCVDAFGDLVAAIKFQVAFFEAHGPEGLTALQVGLDAAAKTGALVIADAKRGDIDSTLQAYTRAWLAPGAPFTADAVTLSPYLGTGALRPAVAAARESGRGVIALAATSNAEARAGQRAKLPDGRSVAQSVVDEVAEWNKADRGASSPSAQPGGFPRPIGPGGVVVGATFDHGLDLSGLGGVILAPGFGAQGASETDVARRFPVGRDSLLVAASRSLLRAGPGIGALRAATTRTVDTLENALRA
ncbi:orotidine 5'-phosphate decarboxylase [Segniliparus rotundus DSM 44985]|uniref:Orotidine-5'-phosphate decarboxylase n=1 Tax=Segniliparus rotundus (strain ATCC BAA-972 / CDC 1076 / CIP 108378 / DSM 44985 / JCM 13578) TaxID=640132 RepID=D6ZAL2_SEGRD|nr:orotidine-5'-phosphate decarboxylase [Segniliparus rotundus]ADG98748.1 orotidine 5'-phosphate decarboxylase [Segniliparus rotundus DSM 44985]